MKPSANNINLPKIVMILIAILPLLVISCDRDNNHPGHTYFPDMVYSTAYESYSENPNFDNNSSFREPVKGTVPRGHTPLPYTRDLEDRARAGKELKNPIEMSADNLERGKVMYERTCLQCHGAQGNGEGHLYTSTLYPFPPASLVNDKVSNLADGEIFHSITYGYGVMGEHGSIVVPEDRWKIILHIRSKLQNTKK